VLKEFDRLATTEVRSVDEQLRQRNLAPIPTTQASLDVLGDSQTATAGLRCEMGRLTTCVPATRRAAADLR